MATSPAPFDPLPLLFLWALWGAIADYRYQRRGGQKPTSADWRGLAFVVVLCVAVMVALGWLGATAEALGRLTALLLPIIFGLWEIRRWRVRRRHPAIKVSVKTSA